MFQRVPGILRVFRSVAGFSRKFLGVLGSFQGNFRALSEVSGDFQGHSKSAKRVRGLEGVSGYCEGFIWNFGPLMGVSGVFQEL